ncbi:MAG: phage holin family protein [Gammaproteobacteria bacterium]|nr:phage holin family protein [Gammaproteobacteria bacterium]
MKLSALFGWKSRLRRLKIAAGETAMAAKDRMQLLRLVANEEKKRLVMGLALSIVLIGLTTITVALVSVAIVVHFWDTPYRVTAAWCVAGFWVALWVIAAALLLATLRKASTSLEPARQEFERDWQWIQHRFKIGEGAEHQEHEEHERMPAHRALSQDELLARIATQRKRVATMSVPAPPNLPKAPPSASDVRAARRPPPANETPTATAVRLAKENPIAAGAAAAAVLAVFGPRRLMRWAAVIAPIAWRMR